LSAIARDSGLKILGPNCLGIANYLRRARITFADYPASRELRRVSVGIASQSGALSQSLAQAIECGASVSHVFSAGNQADVDVADLVAYLADEPACHAIACAFERDDAPRAPARGSAHCVAQSKALADKQNREPAISALKRPCRTPVLWQDRIRRTVRHSNVPARWWSRILRG